MKKSVIVSCCSLALLAGAMQLTSCKENKTSAPATQQAPQGASSGSRIAYVNIDTLENNYTYLKNKREEIAARQRTMESELERSAQQIQSDVAAAQQKMRAGTLSQADAEAAERRIGQMQQSLQMRRASLSEQLMKEQADFNAELRKRLDDFLTEYNKDGRYDYILSYSEGGAILYTNKALDITADIVKGLNEKTPARSADTTKAK